MIAENGLLMMVVLALVEHLLHNFESQLNRDGETWSIKQELPSTQAQTMQMLRALAAGKN